MTKYTIAYIRLNSDGSIVLLALVPDGMDARSAAMEVISERFLGDDQGLTFPDEVGEINYEAGLTLTNEPPKNSLRIAWEEGVRDPDGTPFKYAVRSGRKIK